MAPKLGRLSANLLVLGLMSVGLWGCSSSSDGGAGGSSGSGGDSASSSSKAGSGGSSSTVNSSSGGSSSGGSVSSKSSGGASAVGGSSSSGGSEGGKSSETSSSTSTGTGGSTKGGTTGTGTGGTAKGGTTGTGGTATGTATGGAATGGSATGGTAKGGTTGSGGATGGSATGGSGTGGSGTGGGTGTGKGSPGCGAASPLKSGNFSEKINNVDRQWILNVPSGYDNSKPTRLIFVWHPLGGNAQGVASDYNGLKPLSNNSTIFVAPNGVNGSNGEASGNGWWNKDDADMKFFEAMLKKLNEGLCIDQERIFSTGFSFGGMMSYTLPYVFNVFRATAPCSGKVGVIPFTEKVSDPIPIMAFHGSSDDFVKTALGKEFLDKYRTRNKCGTETKPVSPNGCIEYQGCVATTIWCTFNGGHVTWSEEPAAIWKFFSQY